MFSYLHEVKAKIEKDSESTQLYLTEGVLSQKKDSDPFFVYHPLIYKEVGIELVSDISEPEILITKSDSESSIFITILRRLGVNGSTLHSLKQEFKNLDIDPDDNKINLFLKSLVHRLWSNGKFSEKKVVEVGKRTNSSLRIKALVGKKRKSIFRSS